MTPPDPTQLFSESRFKKLLQVMSDKFDVIVVDCPPITGISDTLMITQLCDSVIYVVESGRATQAAIAHATGRLLQNKAPLSGVVLNKVNTGRKGSEEGYYGYYDYHGYSETADIKHAVLEKKNKTEPAV